MKKMNIKISGCGSVLVLALLFMVIIFLLSIYSCENPADVMPVISEIEAKNQAIKKQLADEVKTNRFFVAYARNIKKHYSAPIDTKEFARLMKYMYVFCNLQNIDYFQMLAIAATESRFNPNATGENGDVGLFQITQSAVNAINRRYNAAAVKTYDIKENFLIALLFQRLCRYRLKSLNRYNRERHILSFNRPYLAYYETYHNVCNTQYVRNVLKNLDTINLLIPKELTK